MILFHGTDREFDAFSSEFLHSNPNRHENGRLGVWVTTDPDLAARFGKYLLAVETPGDRVFSISMGDLKRMGDGIDEGVDCFGEMRRDLRSRSFDMLAVVEDDGTAPTRVILDPEACTIVGRASVSDPHAVAVVAAMGAHDTAIEPEPSPRL